MRLLHFLLLALLTTAALSGCSEKTPATDEHDHDDHDHGTDCPDDAMDDAMDSTDDAMGNDTMEDDATTPSFTPLGRDVFLQQPGSETSGEAEGNMTDDGHGDDCPGDDDDTGAPNQLPIAALNMSLADGTVVNETAAVMTGTTIFFSAEGSVDPDGSIDLIGLTVTDSNSTRIAPNLLSNGAFQTVNFTFDHEGAVNVTLRVLDNQGDATVLETFTFVNRLQSPSGSIPLPGGARAGDPDACKSPSDQGGQGTLPGQQTGAKLGFQVAKGAKWIEATLTAGSGEIAICDPAGKALSDAGTSSVSTDEMELEPAIDYYVMVLSGDSAAATYTVDVIVHHEPKPAS